jgi:hypothetical protein
MLRAFGHRWRREEQSTNSGFAWDDDSVWEHRRKRDQHFEDVDPAGDLHMARRPPKLLVLSDLHEAPEHDDLTSLTYAFASIALLQDQRGTACQLSGHLKSLRLESLVEERF